MSVCEVELQEDIFGVVSEIIEKPRDVLTLDINLVNDLEIDSLLALEVLAVLEQKYNIVLEEEELNNFGTIRGIIDVVSGKL